MEVNSRGLGPADPTARVQNNIKRPNGASEIGEGQGNAFWVELAPGAPHHAVGFGTGCQLAPCQVVWFQCNSNSRLGNYPPASCRQVDWWPCMRQAMLRKQISAPVHKSLQSMRGSSGGRPGQGALEGHVQVSASKHVRENEISVQRKSCVILAR